MTIIQRDDQLCFAVHVYRATLTGRVASVMAKKIRQLAQHHGRYIRVFRRARELEAIFSNEPGYLLGESVWQYFGEPPHMIYCEVLPNNRQALVVVIRDGKVLVDMQCAVDGVADNLMPFLATTDVYPCYYYGSIPLFEATPEAASPLLEGQVIQRLEASVFRSLAPAARYQLQALDLALRTQRLGSQWAWLLWLGLVMLLTGTLWWWLERPSDQPMPRPVVVRPTLQSAYYRLLSGPDSRHLLHDAVQTFAQACATPGWRCQDFTWKNNQYQLTVALSGSTVAPLSRWAGDHHAKLQFTGQGASLSWYGISDASKPPAAIQPSSRVAVQLLDAMHRLMPLVTVVPAGRQSIGDLLVMHYQCRFQGMGPMGMDLLGQLLVRMPLKIESVQLQSQHGSLSGTLQLVLVGEQDDNH